MIIFFTFMDDKVQNIRDSGKAVGLEVKAPSSKEVFFPLSFLYYCLTFRKPNAVVFRYLNDKNSFMGSLFIYISRLLSICLCAIFKSEVLWFLHNVDKETKVSYEFFSKSLRAVLVKKSKKIYVMDELLIPEAEKKYPFVSKKIDYLSFGVRENSYKNLYNDTDYLVETFKLIRNDGEKEKLIGFCPTNYGNKYLHIHYAVSLIAAAREKSIDLRIVLVGDLDSYLKSAGVMELIRSERNIVYINRFVNYDHKQLKGLVDFYWRGLSDQSISYSIYEAATMRVPVLALNIGFVGKAVQHYALGGVVDLNMTNIVDACKQIKSWDVSSADRFLSDHNWAFVADKLKLSVS